MIARCGAHTLHPEWLKGGVPEWDLVLCLFQPVDMQGLSGQMVPGHKWDGWKQYDYICFPDGDLCATAETWNRFFAACRHTVLQLDQVEVIGAPGSVRAQSSFLKNLSTKPHVF